MSECNFYSPEEARPLFGEIVPAYQEAFIPEPWKEVSKCPDELQRCVGGLSSVSIGSLCSVCEICPTRPAYEEAELVERFDALAESRPTAWYVEQGDNGLTLAAIGWKASPLTIATEKYPNAPKMEDWLRQKFSSPLQRLASRFSRSLKEPQIMWLDEVFANKKLKSKGNLQNFGKFVVGLAEMLDVELVAFRTIEPRMTYATKRDFGNNATIFKRDKEVPDRRDFVIVNTMDFEPVLTTPKMVGFTDMSYRKVSKQL